ncbi:MAG: FAD-dependent oxidoreductase [Defluviitaleaceae bacterium]|nr:FAD-dependent oxidoreductase [Defluviitaleaceae bacterium]
MINTELLILGGGPAGLCAAIEASEAGVKDIIVLDRNQELGGQLVKQTHMFFGSEKQYASTRGFDIAKILIDKLKEDKNVKLWTDSTALSIYEDGVITAEHEGKYVKIKPKATVVATGASEKTLAFSNNDLPGIFGAGAVQTLMNQYGVKPGDDVVMLGAGNIGLIVTYQMLQAGVNVKAIIEGAPTIGGYLVHASKVRRMGVPILTSHSVKEAHGTNNLEAVTIWQLNEKWEGIPGTEQKIEADVLCISVGLSPLGELLFQAGCEMAFIPSLSGFVPKRDENLATTVPGIFVAGDVSGVEEASSAMVGGRLAGLSAALYLGHKVADKDARKADYLEQLDSLRHGDVGKRIKDGIAQATI